MKRFFRSAWFPILIVLVLAFFAQHLISSGNKSSTPSYNDFLQQVDSKQISEVKVNTSDNKLDVKQTDGKDYSTGYPPNTEQDLINRLTRNDIKTEVKGKGGGGILSLLTYILPFLLFFGFWIFLMNQMQGGGSRVMSFGKSRAKRMSVDAPKITFRDVAGADEAVQELHEIKEFLENPKKFQALGARIPKGVLLYGPPGTGKTLLARAVAGEADVAFFSMSGADFVEMYVGVGASRVRDLFQQVRERAPAILFIDELDAIGRTRAGSATAGQEERDQTLNQLLVELDGFERDTGVVLIGATNRPDVLDPALLRRGRFDRQIVIDRPDQMGRLAILEVHAKNKPLGPDVNLAALATDTPGFTGADLASVMNEAALLTARRGRNVIAQQELDDAIQRILSGSEGRTTILSPEEKRAVAYHEAGHAVVAFALREAGAVRRISIVGRSRILGSTRVTPEGEKAVVGKRELEHRLAFMMGGRAADEIVLGQATTSSKADLRLATDLARRMVCELGMSDSLGRRALGRSLGGEYLDGGGTEADYSAEVAGEIDREISRLVDLAFQQATQVLSANQAVHEDLAELLVRRETLREGDLAAFAARVSVPAVDGGVTGGGRRLRPAKP